MRRSYRRPLIVMLTLRVRNPSYIVTGTSAVAVTAMFRVIEYFAKSLKVTQGHSK